MFDYDKAFDYKKPSIQIVGKWQPWHQGHTNLFKKALTFTGQVVIIVKDVYKSEGEDSPFGEIDVINQITTSLEKEGYYDGQHYIIVCTPNIVGFLNGPGNGISNYDMKSPEDYIMSSEIREQLKNEGKL
tara:strand:- start:33 stop:422 length:390 start_codon:yes stop_codon:yes gene_type:complete